jgi:hypothetical protein
LPLDHRPTGRELIEAGFDACIEAMDII